MSTRVEKSTTEQLTLTASSNAWLYFPTGMLFIALGVACFWLLGYTARIEVRDGRLSYTRDYCGVWRTFEQSWELGSVQRISIESIQFGVYASLEVFVLSQSERHPLALPASDGHQKQAIVDQLERVRRGERSRYEVESSAWIPALILAITCVAGGIVCWSLMETVTLDADAARRIVRIRRRRVFWPAATTLSQSLVCLTSLQRQEVYWATKSGNKVCYHIVFEDDDGGLRTLTATPLFTEHSSAMFLSLVRTWLKQNRVRRRRCG